jgi:hypothetical protein
MGQTATVDVGYGSPSTLGSNYVSGTRTSSHARGNNKEPQKESFALEKLNEVLRRTIDELGERVVADSLIVVKIQAPYCPDLDTLDRPGQLCRQARPTTRDAQARLGLH